MITAEEVLKAVSIVLETIQKQPRIDSQDIVPALGASLEKFDLVLVLDMLAEAMYAIEQIHEHNLKKVWDTSKDINRDMMEVFMDNPEDVFPLVHNYVKNYAQASIHDMIDRSNYKEDGYTKLIEVFLVTLAQEYSRFMGNDWAEGWSIVSIGEDLLTELLVALPNQLQVIIIQDTMYARLSEWVK
ncbi:MAG: hypothetical protein DRJ64_04270 [Thermoprotei archaeon]|nr:MAG: hypothetical protein DRJ64_04270 [Thermoprotei archaeon]